MNYQGKYRGEGDVKEIQRDKKMFVLKEREDFMFCVRCRPRPRLLSVSSQCWCYWTLLEPRVSQTSRHTARLDLTDKDPLPPPALQLHAQLQAVGRGSDVDVVDLHSGLTGVCSVDIDVHRRPGALRGGLAGLAGQGDDCFSERLPATCPDDPLSHHVAL